LSLCSAIYTSSCFKASTLFLLDGMQACLKPEPKVNSWFGQVCLMNWLETRILCSCFISDMAVALILVGNIFIACLTFL
jgi:hypothetical protein